MRLHDYQRRAAMFALTHKNAILAVDMGLGKTAATLAALEALNPARVLIIAPKRVAESVWKQEAEKWGLECAARMGIVAGTPKKRAAAIAAHDWLVIGRDNVKDVADMVFDVLVIDELTSFKNVTAKRSKAVYNIRAARKIGLTGTFLANGAIDIFAQAAAVGVVYPEGNFYAWRAVHFKDVLNGSGLQFSKWKPKEPLEALLAPIKDNIFTLTAEDWLTIPEVDYIQHPVALPADELDEYMRLDSVLALQISENETLTFNEGQKFAKLQTLCNGFVYDDEGGTHRRGSSAKLESVAEFVRRAVAEGEHVLLFYAYVGEIEWLAEMLTADGLKVARVGRDKDALKQWDSGECDVLAAHPASAGHGLNLQGGGRLIVWSSLTYNYEFWAQGNARLARQGQTRHVQIHTFTAVGTCEHAQYQALMKKSSEQQQFKQLTKESGGSGGQNFFDVVASDN